MTASTLTPELIEDDSKPLTAQQIMELSGVWAEKVAALAKLKDEEMKLRKRLVKASFPDQAQIKEGTNTYEFGIDKWCMKYVHVVNRKVLEEELKAAGPALMGVGIPLDNLIRWKPELNDKAFKAMPEDKQKIFADACLEIKDGSPQLKIVQAKR